jgi:hypothetical protein
MTTPAYNQPDEFLFKVLKELADQQRNPRHCIILMHGFIELLVNTLVVAHCKHGSKIVSTSRDYPHSVKLLLLHEIHVITDSHFDALNWFRKLRNRAAHDALFEVTPNDLLPFKDHRFSQPCQFALLSIDLLSDFWNKHAGLFAPKFSPSSVPASSHIGDWQI